MGKVLLDGQSIKAKIITKELERQLGKEQVFLVDTHGGYYIAFKVVFMFLWALIKCKNIIIMPGSNGLKLFIPLICCFNKLFCRKIHYIVIGGWLHEYIKKYSYIRNNLNKCDYIYVETNKLKQDLEQAGYKNIVILPNCKDLHILTKDELIYNLNPPYKLCTFSRVSKEKGIEDAINAVTTVNSSCSQPIYTLDIYGQIDKEYEDIFKKLKNNFPDYIKYQGTVSFDNTTVVIKNYFIMLFPTYYEGEGFAGSLIDAYSSGVPVIASDWKYNSEFVDNNVGYLFKAKDVNALSGLLNELKKNIVEVNMKKQACLKRSHLYTTEEVLKSLINKLQ